MQITLVAAILFSCAILYFNSGRLMDYINQRNQGPGGYAMSMGYHLNEETFTFTDRSSVFGNGQGLKVLIEFPGLMNETHHGRLYIKNNLTLETVMDESVPIVKGMSGQVIELSAESWAAGEYTCIFEVDHHEKASLAFRLE